MPKFNKEQFDKVIQLIADGKAIRNAVKDVSISSSTFYSWIDNDIELEKRYARATEERATALVEDMLEIADNASSEDVQVARLQVDSRKWIASKLRPKKYGDSSQVKITDGDGEPIKINALFNVDLLNVQTNRSLLEDSSSKEES